MNILAGFADISLGQVVLVGGMALLASIKPLKLGQVKMLKLPYYFVIINVSCGTKSWLNGHNRYKNEHTSGTVQERKRGHTANGT